MTICRVGASKTSNHKKRTCLIYCIWFLLVTWVILLQKQSITKLTATAAPLERESQYTLPLYVTLHDIKHFQTSYTLWCTPCSPADPALVTGWPGQGWVRGVRGESALDPAPVVPLSFPHAFIHVQKGHWYWCCLFGFWWSEPRVRSCDSLSRVRKREVCGVASCLVFLRTV